MTATPAIAELPKHTISQYRISTGVRAQVPPSHELLGPDQNPFLEFMPASLGAVIPFPVRCRRNALRIPLSGPEKQIARKEYMYCTLTACLLPERYGLSGCADVQSRLSLLLSNAAGTSHIKLIKPEQSCIAWPGPAPSEWYF